MRSHRVTLRAGAPVAFRLSAHADGEIRDAQVYLDGHSHGKLTVGVYSDDGGRPGRLLGAGVQPKLRSRAWNSVPIAPTVHVRAHVSYWLAVLGHNGSLKFRGVAQGHCVSEQASHARGVKLPLTWGPAAAHPARFCPLSVYAPRAPETSSGGSSAPAAGAVPPSGATVAKKGLPPASPACSVTVSSVGAAASDVASAGAGGVVCLSAGSYGQLELSGAHSGNVTVESVPGTEVVLAGVKFAAGTSFVTVHNFVVREVFLDPGASHIVIDHNDISGGGEGVINSSVNCSSPNAPVYQGCTSTAPDSFITISGNKIHGFGEGGGEDAVHLSNWENVTISANDIYGLEEHGNHTDAFQSVFGGHGMSFDHNYEHDNQSQGFFIKDGDASDVTVSDNLFLRNDNLGEGENNIQVFNTTGFAMTNNTVWDGQGDLIRAEGAAEALTASVNHNVEQLFSVFHESGPAYTLSEDYDIFKERPSFAIGAHSSVVAKPVFADPGADDYRLASNPNRIGVDWAPSEYVYGPTGN